MMASMKRFLIPVFLAFALIACSEDAEDCVRNEAGACIDEHPCLDGEVCDSDDDEDEERETHPCIPQEEEAFWGASGFEPGEPLDITRDGEWHFIPIDGMRCGDGEPTGIFVNFVEGSEELFFFLQGGGICYNDLSCGMMKGNLSGPHPDRDPAPAFAASHQRGLFNRADPANPMRNANMVVVPHCTGDFHLSSCLNDYSNLGEVHQVGRSNLKRVLEAIVPTVEASVDSLDRALVAGFSAGGVGVTGNFHLIAEAFETKFTPDWTLIMDGGPLFPKPHFSEAGQEAILEKWDLGPYIGEFCPSCLEDGFHKLYETNHELHPGLRSAVVCSYRDTVAFALYGLILNNLGLIVSNPHFFKIGLLDLAAAVDAAVNTPEDVVHVQFLYDSARHGAFEGQNFDETPGLYEFLLALLDRDKIPYSSHGHESSGD